MASVRVPAEVRRSAKNESPPHLQGKIPGAGESTCQGHGFYAGVDFRPNMFKTVPEFGQMDAWSLYWNANVEIPNTKVGITIDLRR